jgi:UDP-N-acetylmuramate dehydrogenase
VSLSEATARLHEELACGVRAGEPMSKHTTFRAGGPAALFVTLDTTHDVHRATDILTEEEVPYTVVGKGSNLLVSDAGYEGAVLALGREFKHRRITGEILEAGAACLLGVLVQEAFRSGLSGLQWGVGIPGTFGGALAMNAGTHEGSVGDGVDSVTVFVPGEGMRLIKGSDVTWGYRESGLPARGIILEGSLRIVQEEPARVRAEMERCLQRRKATQPLGLASAGSVFRNPEGDSAGRLIESAGCKGMRLGGARVSAVHANFIVNEGGATATDVARLVRKVQMTVRDRHGVQLRPEIRFLGSFEEA